MSSSHTEYDLLVIGGGATGSGIALDAALRGLKVLLLEQNDFAEGTSSRSTKLAHGGVRYLEAAVKHLDKEQFKLVKEGLRERHYILRNAPHISHKIALLTPLYHWYEVPYIYAGLVLYDIISGKYGLGRSRILSKKDTIGLNKRVKKNSLKASVKYYDGAFNDTRMVIALLQSAQKAGATVKNYTKVENFIFSDNKIVGVEAYDKIEEKYVKYYVKYCVNATGVFADSVRKMAKPDIKDIIRPSSGIHIVLDKKFLPSKEGLMIPKTEDGRVLFVLPYLDKCLVGTTDNEAIAQEHPKPKDEEIEYLLRHINKYFDMEVKKDDILSAFSGLRPLINLNSKDDSSELVREHILERLECGLLSVMGGKWTTYRSMAQEAVDEVIKYLDLSKDISRCKTKDHKVIGSEKNLHKVEKELQNYTQDRKIIKRLLSLYGDRSLDIVKIAKEEGAFEFLDEEYGLIKAELLYTIRYEYVKKPLDFLYRRSCLALIDENSAKKVLEKILPILKNELSWNEAKYVIETEYAKKLLERAS